MNDTLRWLGTIGFGAFGAYVIIANWTIIYVGAVRREHHSLGPLIGGISVCVALLMCPATEVRRWLWVPLVVDPGCLLMLLLLIASIARGDFRS